VQKTTRTDRAVLSLQVTRHSGLFSEDSPDASVGLARARMPLHPSHLLPRLHHGSCFLLLQRRFPLLQRRFRRLPPPPKRLPTPLNRSNRATEADLFEIGEDSLGCLEISAAKETQGATEKGAESTATSNAGLSDPSLHDQLPTAWYRLGCAAAPPTDGAEAFGFHTTVALSAVPGVTAPFGNEPHCSPWPSIG